MSKDMSMNNPRMSEAAKLAQREYNRRWKQENKDKVRIYRQRYWEKKALASTERGSQIENG